MIAVEVSSADQWSQPQRIQRQTHFSVSIQGTFTATITLQRTYDGGSTWVDVMQWTDAGEWVGYNITWRKHRIGCKSGDYTSGTANLIVEW